MRLLRITLTVLTISLISCMTEDKSQLAGQDFTLTVEYYPSMYIPTSRVIIKKNGNKETISIENIYLKRNRPVDLKKLKISINDSLLPCLMNRYHSKDTIFIKHLESSDISNESFKNFKNNLLAIDLLKYKSKDTLPTIDGISVYISFRTNTEGNNFFFVSPNEKYDTTEFALIKSLFNLIDENLKGEWTKNYSSHLKLFFSLPVRKDIPFRPFDKNS